MALLLYPTAPAVDGVVEPQAAGTPVPYADGGENAIGRRVEDGVVFPADRSAVGADCSIRYPRRCTDPEEVAR